MKDFGIKTASARPSLFPALSRVIFELNCYGQIVNLAKKILPSGWKFLTAQNSTNFEFQYQEAGLSSLVKHIGQ